MAETSGSSESAVELREKIKRSREALAQDLAALRYELNFPLKFKKAFRRHTTAWIGGAVVFGLLLAMLRTRKQKVYVARGGKVARAEAKLLESGMLLGALKLAGSLLQPVVASYFGKKLKQKVERGQKPGW